jgi:hypothetical protein
MEEHYGGTPLTFSRRAFAGMVLAPAAGTLVSRLSGQSCAPPPGGPPVNFVPIPGLATVHRKAMSTLSAAEWLTALVVLVAGGEQEDVRPFFVSRQPRQAGVLLSHKVHLCGQPCPPKLTFAGRHSRRYDQVGQTVTVPSDAGAATLNFFLRIDSDQRTRAIDYLRMYHRSRRLGSQTALL